MQSKSLLIAIAAFAVTATGAQAYGGVILNRANITDSQRAALEEARELRQSGKVEAARDVLVEAGIDETVLYELRNAARETKAEIKTAIETGDYEAFRALIKDTPLAEVITSEADFKQLLETHKLRQSGDFRGAGHIFAGLEIEKSDWHAGPQKRHPFHQLTDTQREALRVAKQANDGKTVRAILEEGGIERW